MEQGAVVVIAAAVADARVVLAEAVVGAFDNDNRRLRSAQEVDVAVVDLHASEEVEEVHHDDGKSVVVVAVEHSRGVVVPVRGAEEEAHAAAAAAVL